MDQSTTKKSHQAKVSNMYSALVHAAMVLEEKYHSAHLTKRRQVWKAMQRYRQKHSACSAN